MCKAFFYKVMQVLTLGFRVKACEFGANVVPHRSYAWKWKTTGTTMLPRVWEACGVRYGISRRSMLT